jgi:hypothetical protein
LGAMSQAQPQISIGISIPGISIGIQTPTYPQFVRVPNHPVYYAPGLQTNYFFYDGLYWVYQQDNWYSSSWYDGPWFQVRPQAVPLYVLRVPVRYYRNPPPYFVGWQRDAPPRWGTHWGPDWQRQHRGWDRWDRRMAPAPAPLPVYQRQYSGERYPRAEQQPSLHDRHYRYQPRDAELRRRSDSARGPGPAARHDGDKAWGRDRDRDRGRGEGRDKDKDKDKSKDKGKDKGRDKGRDNDRNDNDAPGQQRKR